MVIEDTTIKTLISSFKRDSNDTRYEFNDMGEGAIGGLESIFQCKDEADFGKQNLTQKFSELFYGIKRLLSETNPGLYCAIVDDYGTEVEISGKSVDIAVNYKNYFKLKLDIKASYSWLEQHGNDTIMVIEDGAPDETPHTMISVKILLGNKGSVTVARLNKAESRAIIGIRDNTPAYRLLAAILKHTADSGSVFWREEFQSKVNRGEHMSLKKFAEAAFSLKVLKKNNPAAYEIIKSFMLCFNFGGGTNSTGSIQYKKQFDIPLGLFEKLLQ